MPTIKNKTKQILCLTGADSICVKIPAGESVEVSDEHWANNSRQTCVRALLYERRVLVIHEGQNKPKPEPEPEPSDESENDWGQLHWKKAKKLIDAETDTAPLYELLEDEERPKIKTMLASRIEEIEATEGKAV